eukprot:6620120-Alexandrium_andersonii.AAC.1
MTLGHRLAAPGPRRWGPTPGALTVTGGVSLMKSRALGGSIGPRRTPLRRTSMLGASWQKPSSFSRRPTRPPPLLALTPPRLLGAFRRA